MKEQIQTSKRIIFVCSGNVIRSAFCELYSKELTGDDNRFSSIGTVYHNDQIFPETVRALGERNVASALIKNFTPTHISKIHEEQEQSLFLTMTNKHSSAVKKSFPNSNVHLITNIIDMDDEIGDPYFTGEYQFVFDLLDRIVKQIAQWIQE